MGPVLIREVEGVIFRATSSPSLASVPSTETEGSGEADSPLAGIILSSSGFSKQALLQVRSSSVPLAAMHVLAQPYGMDEDADLGERCVSIVWNDRFGSAANGLVEGGMEVRWARSPSANKNAESLGRPVIYHAGKQLR